LEDGSYRDSGLTIYTNSFSIDEVIQTDLWI